MSDYIPECGDAGYADRLDDIHVGKGSHVYRMRDRAGSEPQNLPHTPNPGFVWVRPELGSTFRGAMIHEHSVVC